MNFLIQLLIILIIAFIFIFIAKILNVLGILEKMKMALYGPFIMWKTTKGRNFIEFLARARKLWLGFANVGIVLLVLASFVMFVLILLGALVAFNPDAPTMSLKEILVIPGVNPMIPLWYGLFGLIVAVFIHEFSHGILSRVGNIKIKSLGILLLVIPVGAFVEPDQKEMTRAKRKTRANVYAAGPASNIIFALICAIIFSWGFMSALEPVHEGIIIHVSDDSPAIDAGIESKMQLFEINGTRIEGFDELKAYNRSDPHDIIPVKVFYENDFKTFNVRSGVTITGVYEDTPAHTVNLSRGWIIETINGTLVRGSDDFSRAMEKTRDGQSISATFYAPVKTSEDIFVRNSTGKMMYKRVYYEENITLIDRWDWDESNSTQKGMGFLGVTSAPMGISGMDARRLTEILSRPVLSADSGQELFYNVFMFAFIMPIQHIYIPFQTPVAEIYEVTGPMSILPTSMFWVLANIFYYLFWLNILLGTFNALPAFPLDGSFIFKDGVDFAIWKTFKLKKKKREKVVFYIFMAVTLLVWIAILWTLVAPALANAFA